MGSVTGRIEGVSITTLLASIKGVVTPVTGT